MTTVLTAVCVVTVRTGPQELRYAEVVVRPDAPSAGSLEHPVVCRSPAEVADLVRRFLLSAGMVDDTPGAAVSGG